MKKSMAQRLKAQLSTRNITAILVFGAIIVVFVFFGFSTGGLGGSGVGSVARVNNAYISMSDLLQEQQRLEQTYANLFGKQMDFGDRRQEMQQQALQQLIRSELIYQAATEMGIYVTDKEVADYILNEIPLFKENGVFSRELYSRYLEYARTNPGDFERRIRKEVINLRMRRLFEAGLAPAKLELDKIAELKATKMNLSYVKFNKDEFLKSHKPSAEAVEKAEADAAYQEKIKNYFEMNKEKLAQKEEVKAQHILIAFKAGDTTSEKAALTKIQEIEKKAATENFGKLAAQYSEDPGSKSKNGDLGFFQRGRMVPEFEEVAFNSEIDKVSAPVKTSYGYHLIKVTDKKLAQPAELETHKKQIVADILAEENFEKVVTELEKLLAENKPDEVDAQLAKENLQWQATGEFDLTQDGAPNLNSPSVAAAVREITPQKPLVGKVIRDGADRYVIKLKDFKISAAPAAATTPVEDDASLEAIKRQRAYSAFEDWVNRYKLASHVEINPQVMTK